MIINEEELKQDILSMLEGFGIELDEVPYSLLNKVEEAMWDAEEDVVSNFANNYSKGKK